MKIRSIETILVDLPTIRPHKLAMATITDHSLVIVRIKSDTGLEGLGEAAVIPHYGEETVEGIKLLIDRYFAPHLIGRDPGRFEILLQIMADVAKGNHYAKAAVEMACVDLVAKSLGVPASTLFGGAVHDSLPVLWVLATGNADRDIAEAEEKIAQKLHNLFLVKIGHGDPKENVARAAGVKRALGERASVRVDVNQGWDETTSMQSIGRLEEAGIDVVEQPVPRDNREAMRRLAERFAVPIMADEGVQTVEDALALARLGAADAFSIKLTKHGGLVNTRKVAAIAEAAGIQLFGGTMLESSIGTAAYAQLFSTIPRMPLGCQLFGPMLLKDDIVRRPVEYRDFSLAVPKGPGFGMEIDEDKLEFYRRDGRRRSALAVA